jgi:3-hydroxyanthranilate 3,4-dioxygenase
MTEIPPVIDFTKWLGEHQHELKPPVANQTIYTGEDYIVFVVGGPNLRTDFHVDPYEEYFYQLKGDMYVNIMTDEGLQRVDVREGDMWLLPAKLPHSPQRPDPDSIGLLVERVRRDAIDRFRWYCLDCENQIHEVEIGVRDIVADLPIAFDKFYNDIDAHTCRACGAVHPGEG